MRFSMLALMTLRSLSRRGDHRHGGFWFVKEIDSTTSYLTWRLNVRFGTKATDFWETSDELVALVELEDLIIPAVTRLEMKADPENQRGFRALI